MTSLQENVRRFLDESGLCCAPEFRLLDMQSELGEMGKEILKASLQGSRPIEVTDALRAEFGDLLFSLLAFAVETDINEEAGLSIAISKYRDRIEAQGNAGSNDLRP